MSRDEARAPILTGFGVVSPLGSDLDSFWQANVEGRSGLSLETRYELSGLPSGAVTGRIADADLDAIDEEFGGADRSRSVTLLLAVIDRALADADLASPDGATTALITASGGRSLGDTPESYARFAAALRELGARGSLERASSLAYFREVGAPPNATIGASLQPLVAARIGPLIPLGVEATCATGVRAIAEGARLLQSGEAERAIVATTCFRTTPYLLGSYAQLMAMSRFRDPPGEACKPFDQRRNGMVVSEAAGALVLETAALVERRAPARRYARVAGSAFATGGTHPTRPDVRLMERTIRSAIERAGLEPADIDAINTHGTATRANDLLEARAIHAVFGKRTAHLGISACKSILGHTSVAAGILETAVAALTMRDGLVPGIPSCLEPDPQCDLPISTSAVRREVRAVVKNGFGFGGHYASLVLTRL